MGQKRSVRERVRRISFTDLAAFRGAFRPCACVQKCKGNHLFEWTGSKSKKSGATIQEKIFFACGSRLCVAHTLTKWLFCFERRILRLCAIGETFSPRGDKNEKMRQPDVKTANPRQGERSIWLPQVFISILPRFHLEPHPRQPPMTFP